MKVATIQSNYIPWKGYFDIINDVDIFVFLDDVQYTNRDWRNRNKIKTQNGLKWISIPVGNTRVDIDQVTINDSSWQIKHWDTLKYYYKDAKYFNEYKDIFQYIYTEKVWNKLSDLNQYIIKYISNKILGCNTTFINSRSIDCNGKKQEKILNLLSKLKAKEYISGPMAQDYIKEEKFLEKSIKLVYKDYLGYPEYNQFYPPFSHNVTILDLLFHTGSDAPYFIWGWRNEGKNNGT